MRPGRELDSFVAEKVMGCNVVESADTIEGIYVGDRKKCGCDGSAHTDNPQYPRYGVKQYSTDIAAAWEVMEKIQEKFGGVVLSIGNKTTIAQIHENDSFLTIAEAYSDEENHTAHSICLAALKAVGEKVGGV